MQDCLPIWLGISQFGSCGQRANICAPFVGSAQAEGIPKSVVQPGGNGRVASGAPHSPPPVLMGMAYLAPPFLPVSPVRPDWSVHPPLSSLYPQPDLIFYVLPPFYPLPTSSMRPGEGANLIDSQVVTSPFVAEARVCLARPTHHHLPSFSHPFFYFPTLLTSEASRHRFLSLLTQP
ncbi:unnamed protein product [Protopolystoma xenopodis]|uniref:Uncharacterized protein n=1 Tax=Protopolystoma xenopodis TaxID=117903 RepID=A0A448WK15_9PLAT|nr:unnamed protein product [Protopolystoma xenopodis]